MKKIRLASVFGGLVAFTVGTQATWAAGCTNSSLLGTYNTQAENVNLQNVLQSLKAPPTNPTTGPVTPATDTVAGLYDNPSSLAGNQPGLGRFYFDGAGGIVGLGTAATGNAGVTTTIGRYSVTDNCMGTIMLDSGATFDLVVGSKGDVAGFVRTDAHTGAGDAGRLQRTSSCLSLTYASNFSFALAGSRKVTPPTTGDDTTPPPAATYQPYSALGTVSIDGAGSFVMSQSAYNNNVVQRTTSSGTYTAGQDCSLVLKFDTTTPNASSANFVAPVSFRVQMVDSANGLLSVQPEAGNTLTGSFIAQ